VCGHLTSSHADPSSGDTRCLAVEDRRDLLVVFDDGRDTTYGLLRLRSLPAHHQDPTMRRRFKAILVPAAAPIATTASCPYSRRQTWAEARFTVRMKARG
jgi:hypothetical protein